MAGELSKIRLWRCDVLRSLDVGGLSLLLSPDSRSLTTYTAWGDVDALAEAGFCYAQGIGCRKNLKKSAGFYRQAEAKGMSMVGNSWYVAYHCLQSSSEVVLTSHPRIHKSKYNDDGKSEKKTRSKSKPRKNIFGIKSSS
jgi:TPR repeat protein